MLILKMVNEGHTMSKGHYVLSENSASLALRGQERTFTLPAMHFKSLQ